MQISLFKKLLQSYQGFEGNSKEEKFYYQLLDFIDKNDTIFYRNNLLGHITNSAWITDKTRTKILLIHHKKFNTWFQPGGHCEKEDISLLEGALREAIEETGIQKIQPYSENIFDIDIHKIPKKGEEAEHIHYDVRFWFIAEDMNLDNINLGEVISAKWFSLEELERMNLGDSIDRMLQKTRNEIK